LAGAESVEGLTHSGPRRAAAWLALLTAAAAIAAVAALVLGHAVTLLAAIMAFALGGGALWFAAAHRGPARRLAVLAGVVAVGAGVVAIVAGGALGEIAVLVAVVMLFRVASKSAVDRRYPPVSAERPSIALASSRSDGRAVLLMNPKSGGGKVERFKLEERARAIGIEPMVLQPGDDLVALAKAAARTAAVIGMAGGDGSQALVAQIATEQGIPFVCIPAGTRNHFALDLGIDRDDVAAGLEAYGSSLERQVDLAFVNDRIFVNNVSLGLYAEIVQSDGYRDAKRDTVSRMLPDLLGPNATPFDLRYRAPSGELRTTAQLILVSNNPYELDHIAGMGARPHLDTGLLGIAAVTIAGPSDAAALISLDTVGQIRRFHGWLEWSADSFEVSSSSPVAAGIDGEAVVLEPPLVFRIAPRSLCVRLPPGAATHQGGRGSLRELWNVATSRH